MTTIPNDDFPDLTSTRLESISNMTVGRRGAAVVAIDNDRILVVGGFSSGGGVLSSGEIYDTIENSWTPVSSNMPTRRAGCSGVLIEGKVYIIGGIRQMSMDVFDVMTHEWEETIQMETLRSWCGAVGNGKDIFIFGGEYTQDKAERFNVETKVWETLPLMPRKRSTCCAVRIGKKIYLLGGASQTAVDVFDLDSMAWDKNDDPQEVNLMARDYCCAVSIQHYLLVIGGRDDTGKHLNNAELFDTMSKTCAILPTPFSSNRYDSVAASINTSHVVVAGGFDGLQYLKTAEKADLSKLIPGMTAYNRALTTQYDNAGKDNCFRVSEEHFAIRDTNALKDVLQPSTVGGLHEWKPTVTPEPSPISTPFEIVHAVTHDEYDVLCDDFIIVDSPNDEW